MIGKSVEGRDAYRVVRRPVEVNRGAGPTECALQRTYRATMRGAAVERESPIALEIYRAAATEYKGGANDPPLRLMVPADADPRKTTNTSENANRTNVERIETPPNELVSAWRFI